MITEDQLKANYFSKPERLIINMTRQEMVKKRFQPYMRLELDTVHGILECLLIATNFDNECFLVRLLDVDRFEEDDIWVSISKLKIPKRKMEILK